MTPRNSAQLVPGSRVSTMVNTPLPSFDQLAEQADPVWVLLAQAPPPAPDPWFTVRTLARCRLTNSRPDAPTLVLDRVWRWALGAGFGFSLALVLVTRTHSAATPTSTNQKGVQEAFEIMASMEPDGDTAASSSSSSSDTTSWQDSSL